ncbi:MAG: hypothetical protein EXS09_21255 [Gemmataceae bacterium]|nr:hypothetical protein [Gemmataceae bacterium]
MKTHLAIPAILLISLAQFTTLEAQERFHAKGPSSEVKMESYQQGVVQVHFDLLPTSMRFNAPAYPCMVTENDIQYSNGFAETYDPRLDQNVKETSFEPGFDDFNEYSRMWIESQNDARIVVRVRGALVSDEGRQIAHADIPSGSPHGKGDWVDEWYYIYPDGVHTRHVKIYTGLAARSLPFGSDREPPRVIHEFMEAMVLGKKGRTPQDDIENDAVTLIKTVGDYSEDIIPEGKAKTFSFTPYPRDFGEFSSANILVVNLKSRYKPFTIAMPHGVRTQPYKRDNSLVDGFQVWGPGEHRSYTVPIGHMINYGHYRKTEKTIEQVYLSGVIESKDPRKELVPLAWSWIVPPKVSMETEKPSYETEYYDPVQKAYVFDWKHDQKELEFELIADPDYYGVATTIVNPALVVGSWGNDPVEVAIDDKAIKPGKNLRVGYEPTPAGTSLILWLKLESKEPVNISLSKGGK